MFRFALRRRRFATVLLALATAGIFAVAALADAPDVTNTANYSNLGFAPDHASVVSVVYDPSGLGGQGTTTVTIKGGWAWPTHGKDCNTDRAGAGYAVDWNDPNDPGYAIDNTGISVGSQNPHGFSVNTDANVVQPTPSAADPSNPAAVRTVPSPSDYKNWGGGCGKVSTGTITGWKGKGSPPASFSQGFWGPISHTYVGSPASLPSQICAVTYDVHPGTKAVDNNGVGVPGSAKEITSGGNGANDDNSVEKNGQTPAGNACAEIGLTPPAAPRIDLAVTKTGSPDPDTLPGDITWKMVVTNNGPATATGVTTSDPVPAGNTFVSVSTTQGSCTGGTIVSCSLGTIAAGGSVTITLVTKPSAAGTVTNTVTVVGNETETNTSNNTASASVIVVGPHTPPAVFCTAVSKVAPKQLFVGRKTTLTIHVSRHGKAVRGVRVRIKGAHMNARTAPSNSRGVIKRTVKLKKAGILVFTPLASKRCGTKRVGVTGVFTPPVTG